MTYLEGAEETFVDAHHSSGIVEFAAIVGGTEQGDQLSFGEELVAIFHHLMGPADQVHVVLL